ncbi:tetratricopeptide repeat protein [bacterium]|nr:tetratricopeptide repeat protein [bacterium]
MPEVSDIINIGFSFHQNGKLDDAMNAYEEALRMDDKNAEVYNLLGVLKLQQGDIDSAIEYVEKAISISPESYFFETLFQAYIRKGDYEKIAGKEDYVMKLFPENFSMLFNLGLAYKNLKQNKKAIMYYERALKIDPSSYQGWFNLAHLYSVEAEVNNAVSALKICNKIKPNDDETEYFLGIALMRMKDYKHGLKYFEKRIARTAALGIEKKTYPNKVREDNLWKGENIKDKTLLVYYEAGFGDVIMFSRFLPLAKKKCKKLIFICQKPLSQLFRENRQLGIDEIIDTFVPENMIEFDYHIPLLSIPNALGLSEKDIFVLSDGYLGIGSKQTEEAKEKYFNTDKIKIGIKWQGNTYYDSDRVIPAEKFVPLTQIENTQFYSFQTFEGSEETSKLEGVVDVGKDLVDFTQTAAALNNLELLICNDTSLAHLAGAMGIPTWVILPYEVNWRWHTDLSKCDWYDNVRLFRQKSIGDWNGVMEEIKGEIEKALQS